MKKLTAERAGTEVYKEITSKREFASFKYGVIDVF